VLKVDYPGIVPREGKSVRGMLVENLTKADVGRLDAFEGDVRTCLLLTNDRNTNGEM